MNLFARTVRIIAVVAFAFSTTTTTAQAEPADYKIDAEHFSVGFLVSHIGYENLLGMFLQAEGSFSYDAAAASLSDIRIEIAADSVFTNHKQRDKHLRSPDFLNAREFPEIVFTGTRVEKTGENTGIVEGQLELLGQSRPITLEITLNKAAVYPFGHKKHTLGISARTSFNRSDFGMSYSVSDGLVGDEVNLILEFEAIEQ